MAFNPYKHKFVARDQFGNVVWIEQYPPQGIDELGRYQTRRKNLYGR